MAKVQTHDDEHVRRFVAYAAMVREAFDPGNSVVYAARADDRFVVERRGVRLALTRIGSRIEYRITNGWGGVEHGELPEEERVREMLGRLAGRGGLSLGK